MPELHVTEGGKNMGYYVSTMIGIRAGGVFSGKTDTEDMKQRVAKVIKEMRDTDNDPDIEDDPSHCMSVELEAHKGSYVVLAGVFNYWTFDRSSEFAKKLSGEFGTEIMIMSWDEENDTVQCQVYFRGKPLFEVNENPIGLILRRVC
jgi:hypothetical protein